MLTLVAHRVLGSRLFGLVRVRPGLEFLDLCSNMQLSAQVCTGASKRVCVCVRVRGSCICSVC